MRLAFCLSVVAAVCVVAGTAQASAGSARAVWVEVDHATCGVDAPAIRQHVELACDAVGSCTPAAAPNAGTELAFVMCGSAGWLVTVGEGDASSATTIVGPREERLRQVAMRIASAAAPAAPRRNGLAASVSTSPPLRLVDAPPSMHETPTFAASGTDPDALPVAASPQRHSTGGLLLLGSGGVLGGRRREYIAGGGLRVGTAFAVGTTPFRLGVSGGVALYVSRRDEPICLFPSALPSESGPSPTELAVSTPPSRRKVVGLHAGASVGWGAPFGNRPVGVELELGAMAVKEGSYIPSGYGRLAVFFQIPLDFPLRPTLALNATHYTNLGGQATEGAGVDLGVVWQAW